MKTILILTCLLFFGSCSKNNDPIDKEQEQEEMQDGVKLGYRLAKGKWHQVTHADVAGQIYFAKNDLYRYSVEGTIQYTAYLHRFNESTRTWVKLYEQLNPQTEKTATDPSGNVYMAITHLRTEGSGVGTTKFFYTYKIQRLTANDQWESLGEIPNPAQAAFLAMDLFHISNKLHFFGTRNNKLTIYTLNGSTWAETTAIDNVINSGKFHHHTRTDGKLAFTVAKTNKPDTYITYTFDGSQLQEIRQDDITTSFTLGEDGLYYNALVDAVLYNSRDKKEIFNLPAVTISNHEYARHVSKLASNGTKVYAQVQRYVIPEWLNEVLAIYDTATGKVIWIPNTPDYNSKAVINDVVNRGKRHYFLLQKQVLNVSQRHLYYFEEE